MDNFCEFIKKIHADPMQEITDLKVGEFYKLKEHIQKCENCSILVDEVIERYKDVPAKEDKTKYN